MFRFLLFLFLLAAPALAGEWELHRMEGRDYITVKNLVRFYGLKQGEAAPGDAPEQGVRPVSFHAGAEGDGRSQIVLKANSREAFINGIRQWLSFPVREKDGELFISRIDLAKTIEPALRPQRIANLAPVETVVLDPGHGGHDRGAVSRFGDEKTYTLDICRRVKPLLEARGLRVVLTRDRDLFVPLEQRPKVANALPNSIFVAVHFNSASTNASGLEVFSLTPRGAPSTADEGLRPRDFREEPGNSVDVPSAALAASVHHAMLGLLDQSESDRGLKHARFAVIRLATVPSILIEGGFLSHGAEAEQIHTEAWRQRLAESIARGILGYKGLSELRRPPELVADYRREGASPDTHAAATPPEEWPEGI